MLYRILYLCYIEFLPFCFCRGQKTLKAATDTHAESETASTGKQSYTALQSLEKAMAELDNPEHMPEGLDEHVWQRLVEARRVKVESEQRVCIVKCLKEYFNKVHL